MHDKLMKLITAMAFLLAPGLGAHAHEDAKPSHGGIVQVASELTFELVRQQEGVAIFVRDHGKPLPVAGMSGKLVVMEGGKKCEAELAPPGDRLIASGATLARGAILGDRARRACSGRFDGGHGLRHQSVGVDRQADAGLVAPHIEILRAGLPPSAGSGGRCGQDRRMKDPTVIDKVKEGQKVRFTAERSDGG